MVDETLQCIRESMMGLLAKKEYSKIQMKEIAENAHVGRKTLYRYFDSKESLMEYVAESLMNRLADGILTQGELSFENVTYAFFEFVRDNQEEFRILKKGKVLSYLEDNLFALIAQVAAKTKYKGKSAQEVQELTQASLGQKYALHFMLAGHWRMAMVWIDEDPFLSPRQMMEMSLQVMSGSSVTK
ncbi:MAG: TetR/AcrR family transcriptional regulator [Lachnospiraceae bacterium]|nr:TetR/AcrR family transcriptional regulator [Candidatus Equihabitans merdae]